MRDVTPLFLNSAFDRDLLLASCPGRFIPSDKIPGTAEMRGYVEHGPGLYCVEERRISSPRGGGKRPRSHERPTRGMVTILPELSWLKRRCRVEI